MPIGERTGVAVQGIEYRVLISTGKSPVLNTSTSDRSTTQYWLGRTRPARSHPARPPPGAPADLHRWNRGGSGSTQARPPLAAVSPISTRSSHGTNPRAQRPTTRPMCRHRSRTERGRTAPPGAGWDGDRCCMHDSKQLTMQHGRTTAAPRPHHGRTTAAHGRTTAAPRPSTGLTPPVAWRRLELRSKDIEKARCQPWR